MSTIGMCSGTAARAGFTLQGDCLFYRQEGRSEASYGLNDVSSKECRAYISDRDARAAIDAPFSIEGALHCYKIGGGP